jgi:hypothetical protein
MRRVRLALIWWCLMVAGFCGWFTVAAIGWWPQARILAVFLGVGATIGLYVERYQASKGGK